jgi:uncharacterized metal-binding protein
LIRGGIANIVGFMRIIRTSFQYIKERRRRMLLSVVVVGKMVRLLTLAVLLVLQAIAQRSEI